jgi:hypothetical protein
MDTLPSGVLLNGGFRSALICFQLSLSCPFRLLHTFPSLRPARHYPRLWIRRSSSERRRDLNPHEQRAAQHTLRRSPTPPERARPHYSFSLSRIGLVPGWSETFWRSPGSRACCFSACAGSLTTQGRRATRDLSQSAVLLSPGRDGVSALLNVFSKLNSPAHRYPYLRFERNLTASPARLRAKMESLSPFL